MYILKPDEKTTPVMIYTQDTLIRGEVVTKQNVPRVNIWLRTDGVPRYLHVLKPQVLIFGGTSPKPLSFSEIHYPASRVIGFHVLPPADEPLDYDPEEENRMMQDVHVLVGTFIVKGRVRISTQTELSTSLDVARVSWISVYEAEITNPYLAQMPPMHVPMMLVKPENAAFGLL
ncbi:MAG: hypothetical protein C3F07_06850 [Anaerolineales bacterium]|nr:hypothetical protein [Anaerolineae bacterium]PWB74876.1 MAG: hypothetical protein C3F07_06850 [Anaerolineales bacterium]